MLSELNFHRLRRRKHFMDAMSLIIGALVGGAMGFWCGTIPSKAAASRNRHTFAMVSLTVCTLTGMIGGCLLALPLAFILKMVVIGMGEEPGLDYRSTGVSAEEYHAIRRSVSRKSVPDPLATAPFTVLGRTVICNACRMACSKENDEVPRACPHCGEHFVDKVVPIARVSADQSRPRRIEDGSDLIELKNTY